ncbi:hypothetical protein DFP72DRAFT_1005990 [Ephemerocybe angulata]|uniref:F-box domain-containing protein n=1 Tax=Ephemerocybe angulata TaxID=980116 RepID=A0A8H6I6I9_9AGAR|nr:hypothetical protein DFP72DRAFT_1005990 [Tulosesus angulatus]
MIWKLKVCVQSFEGHDSFVYFHSIGMDRKTPNHKSLDSILFDIEALEAEVLHIEARLEQAGPGSRTELQQALQQLRSTITTAHIRYNEAHNSQLPLFQLPNEVLGVIFRLAQRNSWFDTLRENPGIDTQVRISHVCKHWRDISLSLLPLWSVFRYRNVKSLKHCIPLRRLEIYLERSKDYPLDLWFNLFLDGTFDNARASVESSSWPQILKLLALILPHIHRIRELHITAPDGKINDFLSHLQKASAPALEFLTIVGEKKRELFKGSNWSPNIFLGGAPRLKYLRSDDAQFSRPPLQSIVQLRLEQRAQFIRGSPAFSLSLLEEILTLPHLEILSMCGHFLRIEPAVLAQARPKIEARKLTHLRCDGYLSLLPQYILSHVEAPVLETITFSSFNFSKTSPAGPPVNDFPSLHTLVLIGYTLLLGQNLDTDYAELTRLPWLLDLMAVTHRIKKLFLMNEAKCGAPEFMYAVTAALSTVAASRLTRSPLKSWADNLEEIVLDIPSIELNLDHYLQLTQGLPKLSVAKMNRMCMNKLDETRGSERWERMARVKAVEGFGLGGDHLGRPIIPVGWVPGPEWIEGDLDPLASILPLNLD